MVETRVSSNVKVKSLGTLFVMLPEATVPTTDPFIDTCISLAEFDTRTPTLDALTFIDVTVRWLLFASPLPLIPTEVRSLEKIFAVVPL